jgi:hypothetical protein
MSDATDNPQREVECARCGDVHKWSDRLEVQEDIWTVYRCPVCGDESYTNCRTILPEDSDLPF